MCNLVVIERYNPSSFFWPNLLKDKKIQLPVEMILNKYQGFEGEMIAFFKINKSDHMLKEIIEICLEKKKYNNYFILYVISGSGDIPLSLREQAFRVGYDIGVCEEDKTIYSSIFNEIIFGHLDELVVFKDFLNENLLFEDRSLAEKYVSLHNLLSIQGKGVEDYEKMTIYDIWQYRN